MPKNMPVNEPTVERQAKRNKVKFLAANGAGWRKKAEKRVRFKRSRSEVMNSITFQAKPLAAVSTILDKRNAVVFSRESAGSYIDQGDWGLS